MSKMRRLFKGGEAGFTLIELLVVIAVLGILAAIAIPRLGGVTDKAKMSEAVSAMGSFKTSLEMYSVENDGAYPANEADFQSVLAQYVDNFSGTTYNGNETWDLAVTGIGDSGTISNGAFTIQMTVVGEDYLVEMSHTDAGYTDVTTGVSP